MRSIKLGFWSCVVFAVFGLSGAFAQDVNPIRWSVKKENSSLAVKAGDKFNAHVIATIDDGWHLYSLDQPVGGPIPTRIAIPENQKFKLAGDIESPQAEITFDPNFNVETQIFEREAIFILPIEVTKDAPSGKNSLIVTTFYQTCNDKRCLPPKTLSLTLDVDVAGGTQSTPTATPQTARSENKTNPIESKVPDSAPVEFDFVDFTGKPRKISEFRGRFVLIDFWATWCRPCLADIPKLKELYQKHKDAGFEIVGMDAETLSDDDEAPDPDFAKQQAVQAKKIVATRGVIWTQATAETAVPIAKKVFAVKALPTKILLDKDGKVIARIGENDDLIETIERMLVEKK